MSSDKTNAVALEQLKIERQRLDDWTANIREGWYRMAQTNQRLERERDELAEALRRVLGHMDQLAMPDESAEADEAYARAILKKVGVAL